MNLSLVQDDLTKQYKDKLLESRNLKEQLKQVDELLLKLAGASEVVASLQDQQEREDAEEKARQKEEAENASSENANAGDEEEDAS